MTHRPVLALALAGLLSLSPVLDTRAQETDRAPVAQPAPTPTADEAPDLVRTYQETITPGDLAAHLYLFASDFFEGRETAERGQKLAAAYLAAQYRKMGVQPAGTASTDDPLAPDAYFQPFPLYSSAMTRSSLTVTGTDGATTTSVFSEDERDGRSYPGYGGGSGLEGGVIFGGFGISDEQAGFDEVAALSASGLDLASNWLVVLAGEPLDADGRPVLSEDGSPTRWAGSPNVKLGAFFRGDTPPLGILYVADFASDESMAAMTERAAAQLGRGGRLSLDPPDGESTPARGNFPSILMISTDLADAILAGTGHTVRSLASGIAGSREPNVFAVEGSRVASDVSFDVTETSSENVLGFIEGSDPELKDQVVVISSHYDHVGVNEAAEGDGIFNGADDDGSGTVAVLEIAEAFARAREDGHGPRRSVLFLNVTGEEKGLLGSAYYTDHQPVFPIENTVTNLNIDMIGRVDPTHPGETDEYVYIIGSNLISQELHDINLRMNSLLGTDLDLNERFNSKDDPNQFYRRSDHWNFGKHQVPFIFFFTGTHEDYHGVDDEPEKILYERMADISRLIFATAWQVANQDTPPEVTGTGFN
jgi:hypothetical protein